MILPRLNGQSGDVLEGVGNDEGNGGSGGVANLNGQTDEIPNSQSELIDKFCRVHCDDLLAEDSTTVVSAEHDHTVEEGLEVELLQQGGFRVTNSLANGTDLVFLGDLNLSLFNLGGDLEGVEEVDLRRIEAGSSGLDDVVDGRCGTDLGFSGELALLNLVLEVEDGLFGEDESDLLLEVGEQGLELGLGCTELFQDLVVLVVGIKWFSPKGDDLVQQCLCNVEGIRS